MRSYSGQQCCVGLFYFEIEDFQSLGRSWVEHTHAIFLWFCVICLSTQY